MIVPETVRYDGKLASSLCCEDLGGTTTAPIKAGENFCVGQPVSLDDLGEAFVGTDNYVGIVDSIASEVTYAKLGGQACTGIPVFGDGDELFAGIEVEPTDTFILTPGIPASGSIPFGNYEYVITFEQTNCNGTHESLPSDIRFVSIITALGGSVDFTNIPLGIYSDTTARNIYRRVAGVGNFEFIATIPDNTTTTFTDTLAATALPNPPATSTMEAALTNVSLLNFSVGTYDLGSGCIIIPTGEEGCIADNCLKSPRDMAQAEFAVKLDECKFNPWDVTIDNPSIPRQLRHWDAYGTSRKVRRLIRISGTIVAGGCAGQTSGIAAVHGIWKTAATPTLTNDGFFKLEWQDGQGTKYFTQAQVFGSKPVIELDDNCSTFYTRFSVELVTEGNIFVGDEQTVIVEEGHVAGLDTGEGGVAYSQSGLSDVENPTIIDASSCNTDSEIPLAVRITWTGLQDQAELPPNTGDSALGDFLSNFIIFANVETGAAIKFNVQFKRTDVIEIDTNGTVFYNGVENPTIVDPIVSIPPTLVSGTANTLVLADDSYWGQNGHGKLIQAETSYFNVL